MYNITGWSGGGRRPLTYNLMPGQFRNTRVNVFSQPTVINNNIGGFGGCYGYYDNYGCCGGGGDSGMPKWMQWMMGLGMGTTFLGGILSMFGGGGDGVKDKATTDDNTLKTQAKELAGVYGVDKKNVSVIDGVIRVNINGKIEKCDNLTELEKALAGADGTEGDEDLETDNTQNAQLKGAELTVQTVSPKFHAKLVNGTIKYYSDDDPNTLVDNFSKLTTPPAVTGTLTTEQINTKKAAFAELFNQAYITANFQTSGEHAGKLKVGEQYYDNVTNAYKAYVSLRQNGSGTEVVNNVTDLATIFGNGKTMSVIDDSETGDLINKSISNFNANAKTVTIGGRNYNIEIKGNGKYVYLTDATAGTSNKQVYILEKTSGGKYQITQRPDLANVDTTGGWNKAATT